MCIGAPDGQRYRLGLVLPELGFKVIHRMDLRREALRPRGAVGERESDERVRHRSLEPADAHRAAAVEE